MTPHEGELKRLIGDKKDRKESALSLSAMSGAVVVLKGKNTLITDGVEICENTTGDNTLAKAGSGDVLSGIIGSLWVQKAKDSDYRKSAISSAAISVWIHGRCGDLAKKELTNRGLLSSEIASVYLPKVFKELA
jgi:NAD(P)H-hydrate epimerase